MEDNLRLRISLLDTKVWREVLVPPDFTLARLHTVIQLTMGWEDYHLHDFSSGRTKMSEKIALGQVFCKVGAKLLYTYDYGDSWDHEVKLVGRVSAAEETPLPSCTDGQLACPPEDCGGVPGYEELRELLGRTDLDEDEQDRVEWAGDWDPLDFDRDAANRALAKKFKSKSKSKKAAQPESASTTEASTPTDKQGQYLAFIFWFTRINRCPPAQSDIQRFFGVSAPAVHQMITTLEKAGFLSRIPGQARAIQVTLDQSQLPPLEEPPTPMNLPGRGWVRR